MISKLTVGSLVVALSQAGKCPFGYGSSEPTQQEVVQLNGQAADSTFVGLKNDTDGDADSADSDDKEGEEALYPSDVLKCPTHAASATHTSWNKPEYEAMFKDVSEHIEALPVAQHGAFAACLVRLAGHDFMDFRWSKDGKSFTGGSDGCVNFKDPDNMGLAQCLKKFNVPTLYHKYCADVSLADFIVLSAEMSMGRLATTHNAADPFAAGTLAQKFRDQLYVGRQTVTQCPDNIGLMPNPENGCEGLKSIFVDHIWRKSHRHKHHRWIMTAAISGAHTLGQAHLENSGYDGHWSTPEDQGKFNNGYFKSLLAHGWGPKKNVSGNPNKNMWVRIDKLPCNSDHKEMMLSTDICLAYQFNQLHADCMKKEKRRTRNCNKLQRKGRFSNAKTDSCCAWSNVHILTHKRFGPVIKAGQNDFCGVNAINGDMRAICCEHEAADSIGDCDAFNWPKGPMFDWILRMAGHESEFYRLFLQAWKAATMNGFPKPLRQVKK